MLRLVGAKFGKFDEMSVVYLTILTAESSYLSAKLFSLIFFDLLIHQTLTMPNIPAMR